MLDSGAAYPMGIRDLAREADLVSVARFQAMVTEGGPRVLAAPGCRRDHATTTAPPP